MLRRKEFVLAPKLPPYSRIPRRNVEKRCEKPRRGKGTSLNSTSLTPKPFASSVYVHIPEAPSSPKRSISVMSLFPFPISVMSLFPFPISVMSLFPFPVDDGRVLHGHEPAAELDDPATVGLVPIEEGCLQQGRLSHGAVSRGRDWPVSSRLDRVSDFTG